MKYEEAVKLWAAKRLPDMKPDDIASVEFEYDEGYACCGGSDPLCYCSYAESPSFNAVAYLKSGGRQKIYVDSSPWDLDVILRELFAISEGEASGN